MEELLKQLEMEVPAEGREKLRTRITNKQIEKVLKHSKNSSAAGLDGIPYEFWKRLQRRYNEKIKMNQEGYDIIRLLTKVYNHIEENSVT